MPLFFKGVPASSFNSTVNFQLSGLLPRDPGGGRNVHAITSHICDGTTMSAFISLTRSYAVAEEYAYSGRAAPTPSDPGFVYEVLIDNPPPAGVDVIDPVYFIAESHKDALSQASYHHDGGKNVLLGIASPNTMGHVLLMPVKDPPMSGRTPRGPYVSRELETLVRALRDSEVLVAGSLPRTCFVNRHTIV